MKGLTIIAASLAIILTLLLAGGVFSADRVLSVSQLVQSPSAPGAAPNGHVGGTRPPNNGGPVGIGEVEVGLDDADDPLTFPNTRFVLNGIGMRGGRKGILNVVGPPEGSVLVRGFVYWQWACLDEPRENVHNVIRVKRVFPGEPNGARFTGTLVGVGENPSWCGGDFKNYTYRADITDIMSASGGGTYALTLSGRGAVGSQEHRNPWADNGCPLSLPPLAEGAAIVAVYRSSCEPNGTVYIYDAGLAGPALASAPGFTYELQHQPGTGLEARLGLVGGDGQTGAGYVTLNGPALVETAVNGFPVAGPNSLLGDSDWNGSVSKPLPQLFDVTGHEISEFVAPGATTTSITFQGPSAPGMTADVIVPVVNVLLIR